MKVVKKPKFDIKWSPCYHEPSWKPSACYSLAQFRDTVFQSSMIWPQNTKVWVDCSLLLSGAIDLKFCIDDPGGIAKLWCQYQLILTIIILYLQIVCVDKSDWATYYLGFWFLAFCIALTICFSIMYVKIAYFMHETFIKVLLWLQRQISQFVVMHWKAFSVLLDLQV